MYKELRKQAKKRVEAKTAFYTCAIIFSGVSMVLLLLSFYLSSISFWLRLPIPILMMVLGVLYITAFGWSATGELSDDWQEDEIEKEMVRRYQQKKLQLPPLENLSEKELLELKELERLQQKWSREEDYV